MKKLVVLLGAVLLLAGFLVPEMPVYASSEGAASSDNAVVAETAQAVNGSVFNEPLALVMAGGESSGIMSVCDEYIASGEWLMRGREVSLSLTPTACGLTNTDYDAAFAEITAKFGTDIYFYNEAALKDQYVCHHVFAGSGKLPWNIEPFRPQVGQMQMVMAQCNPANNNLVIANPLITVEKGAVLSEEAFIAAVQASVLNGAVMSSDFNSAVNLQAVGEYKVWVSAANAISAPARVLVQDTIAPILTVTELSKVYSIAGVADETAFLATIGATSNEADAIISSDYSTVVHPERAGTYPVQVVATDSSGNISDPVIVTVTIKALPLISANTKMVTYSLGAAKSEAEFYADLGVVADDDSLLASNFAAVDFLQAGMYTVMITATDSLGGNAEPVTVTVHIVAADSQESENNILVPDGETGTAVDAAMQSGTTTANQSGLPATGSNSAGLVVAGMFLLLAGSGTVVLGRRYFK